jgi:16S rRNA (guanine966-N2)-methyltransferase
MRIIAGEFRSRRLKTLPGMSLRPTSDRLRETLFNVLGDSLRGARFVDCYAGSGAVGLEALSRGAASVVFVEQSTAALRVLRDNIRSLGVDARATVIESPADRALRRLDHADIVFLDPPYAAAEEYQSSLEALRNSAALIVAEHASRTEIAAPEEWARVRLLKQGDSALSFFRRDV